MLTQEGRDAARECLTRSGLTDPIENNVADEEHADPDPANVFDVDLADSDSSGVVALLSVGLGRASRQKKSIDVPLESLERVSFQLLLRLFLVFASLYVGWAPITGF